MKHLLLIILTCCFYTSFSQKIVRLYSWDHKPAAAENARYYSSTEWKDSVWERKDFYLPEKGLAMKGSYLDSNGKLPVGAFYYFYPSKNQKAKEFYNELGKKEGRWLAWHDNGRLKDSGNYENGGLAGAAYSWYANGRLKDSVFFSREDGLWARHGFFRNGQLSERTFFRSGKKHGIWSYYNNGGKLTCTEEFVDGELIASKYYDERGKEMNPLQPNADASFEGGTKKLQKYFFKEVDFPDADDIRVSRNFDLLIGFVIDENGEVDNITVLRPVHPAFDRAAVEAIQKIKGFIPARSKNRSVESRFVQNFNLKFLL